MYHQDRAQFLNIVRRSIIGDRVEPHPNTQFCLDKYYLYVAFETTP